MGSPGMQRGDGSVAPIISVGLPVYNGGRHLARAIDSILTQSYADLELIISDNASTDDTPQICEAFRRQDGRVRYFRQRTNIGASRNWNFVVAQARGHFFKWASANDYCAPTLLSKCAEVLTRNSSVVLCYSRTVLIDETDNTLPAYDGDFAVLDERPSNRYVRVRRSLLLNNAQMGLIRLEVLRRTRLEGTYPNSDSVLTAELALHGRFWLLSEPLFYRRMSRESASRFLSKVELRHFIDPLSTRTQSCDRWQLHWNHVAVVMRSPIGIREKLSCLRLAAREVYWDSGELWSEVRARFLGTRGGG